jgi:putative transposase
MMTNQAAFGVQTMCQVLGVSSSGYYGWLKRVPSMRSVQNAVLVERIRTIHADSDATYGMPRVRAELLDQGVLASRKRVARLMRAHGLRGLSRRRGFVVTTQRDSKQRPAPDLVKRHFVADGPNQLWVADMTYVPTWAGFIFLAIVLDVWSRRVVGWSIGERMIGELVSDGAEHGDRATSSRRGDSSQRWQGAVRLGTARCRTQAARARLRPAQRRYDVEGGARVYAAAEFRIDETNASFVALMLGSGSGASARRGGSGGAPSLALR